jgi:hypothetical protein
MERRSISPDAVTEIRLELSDLAKDSDWRHKVVMAELADLHEAISHRPSLINFDLKAAMPWVLAVVMPLAILVSTLVSTGSPEKAIQAATTSMSVPK